jgi:diadenosine tetraphosphate (Ap4A) HIT family hydrolase
MTYEETVWVSNDTPLHDYGKVAIFLDKDPVITSHLLFIPKENTNECIAEAYKKALEWAETWILTGGIDGANIGQNVGVAAGQTVMWPHIHFIPRREGDSDKNASNGIRLSHPGGVQIDEHSKQL